MKPKSNQITANDFKRVVQMANLDLSDSEKAPIQGQLNEALQAIQVFDELDLANVPPLEHPSGISNVMRQDVVTPSLPQDLALANAPAQHDGYVMVKGVFEDQS